ncbi:MAG TPA: tetratricopeptide repeat-containing sensor histidine kinase [Dinghuibacter sp.]|uniref:tetratricopeptide repeat-containing sensor histidine kinase n=1 Tax=Dinghuibacter sp. TaxID=2024697 RepID=UPI002CB8B628|nr:tetratricopeptide repeat-containing sensor histidine kinase [Dinghuibacter sp.]HTJ11557.1 tetratricopeptide repeat-containing sensor histidine kinase [Dinghuibacter sp.]
MRRFRYLAAPLFGCFFAIFSAAGQAPEMSIVKGPLSGWHDSLRYVDALNRLSILEYNQNIDSTFLLTRQARDIADRLQYQKGIADAINNLGVVYFVRSDHQLAFRYFNEAYNRYVALRDSSNIVQTMMNIGLVYRVMGRTDKAIDKLRDALAFGAPLRQDSIMALVYSNYAATAFGQIGGDSAMWYLDKSREIALRYNDQGLLAGLGETVANVYAARGQTDTALALFAQAIDQALTGHFYLTAMTSLIDMGDLLMARDPDRAIDCYKRALEIMDRKKYFAFCQVIVSRLIGFYKERHDGASELYYSRLQLAFQGEQDSLNKASGVDYIDYALKDQQVRSLETKAVYQQRLLLSVGIAGLLFLAILVIIWHNLGRAQHFNRQMQTTLRALEGSQADNTRMIRIVAHDLRNPIGGITSIADMLLDEDRMAEDRRMLELIKIAGTDCLELVQDLLRVNDPSQPLTKEAVDLDEMLRNCIALLRNKATAKQQFIHLDSSPLVISANPEKLWRVLSNLISNAIKFSPSLTTISVALRGTQGHALITVTDVGIGIPKDMQQRLFDMFTDARRRGTAGEESFGLGLAISKQIVEAHGGRIWFDSEPGVGTTFLVELPAGPESER